MAVTGLTGENDQLARHNILQIMADTAIVRRGDMGAFILLGNQAGIGKTQGMGDVGREPQLCRREEKKMAAANSAITREPYNGHVGIF